jgi:hypothetical protein
MTAPLIGKSKVNVSIAPVLYAPAEVATIAYRLHDEGGNEPSWLGGDAMSVPVDEDMLPLGELPSHLVELADEVVARQRMKVFTRDGVRYVALVDVKQLETWRALEAEFANLELLEAAMAGLQAAAAGHVLTEEEADRLLSEIPAHPGP